MDEFLTLPGIYDPESYDECEEAWNMQMMLDSLDEWDDPQFMYHAMISGANYEDSRGDYVQYDDSIIFDTLHSSLSWEDVEYKIRYHIDRIFILDGKISSPFFIYCLF